jgi:hypothetical protein
MRLKEFTFNKLLYYTTLMLGMVISAFFSVFLISNCIGAIVEGKFRVIPVLLLMSAPIAGYIWTFLKPKRGGLVMITGGFVLTVYLLFLGGFSEINMALIFGLPFIAPGFIYFFYWKRISKM